MTATIPIPSFRGRTTAYATRAPVVTGSLKDPADAATWTGGRTLHYAGVPHSFAQVVITARGLTSDLDASTWKHDDGSVTLSHSPFGDDEWRWQIQYRATGGDEWADAGLFIYATPMRLQFAVGTVASLDLSSGQVGPMCHLLMGDDGSQGDFNHGAGQYRAVGTRRTRGPNGTYFTGTHLSQTWTLEDSAGTVYYIAASGSNANDGLSSSTPWADFTNVPATGSCVVLLKDGDTIDTTTFEGMRASTDRHHAVYGVPAQTSPTGATVRAVTGFNDARHLWESNYNGASDATTDCTFCHINVDCNGIARGGWQTVDDTSDTDCVFNGVSWFGCTVSGINGGNTVSKGWDLSFGKHGLDGASQPESQRSHIGICFFDCHVIGVDNGATPSPTSDDLIKQGIYFQGAKYVALTGCTFKGAAIDSTLDHGVYANNTSDILMRWCGGDPDDLGLRQRGFLLNVGITLDNTTEATQSGICFSENDCSGCKVGLDCSQSQFDAGPSWNTHWLDDIVCECNYAHNEGTVGADTSCNGIASFHTTKNHWFRNNVGYNIGRDLYSYGANVDKLYARSQDYCDLSRARIDNNHVVNETTSNTGRLSEIATFARGIWDIDLGYITQPDTGSTRHIARYDQSYIDGTAHAALGGGIRRGNVSHVSSGNTARILARTVLTAFVSGNEAGSHTESEAYVDEATLATDYPAVTFQEAAFGYDDPANEDFGGLGEPPSAPELPAVPSSINDLPFLQDNPISGVYGDLIVIRTLLNPGNDHIHCRADSFDTPSNVISGRLFQAFINSVSWRAGAMLLANQYLGAAGDYEFANVTNPAFAGYGKFGQQPFCALQHHLDLNAGDAGDPVGMDIGNANNYFNHFDSGSGPLFAACFHLGGWVSIHSDATVLTRAPAQNEYYRHIIESTHITRFGLMKTPFLTGTENVGVRPLYLHPGPDAAGRNTYTDNISRTLCDLSGIAYGDSLPGSILDAGIEFRGNRTSAWRDRTPGTSQAAASPPEPASINTVYGTGDKATNLGDLFVEPVSNAYAWGIRHNSSGINTGDFLPAVGPVLVYRCNESREFVGGPVVTYQFGNSNSFSNVGAGQSSGLNDGDQKNTEVAEDANVLHQLNLGSDRVILWSMFAEEGVSLATIQTAHENMISAARTAFPGKEVYLLLFTNFMHKTNDGTSEASARSTIESDRDNFRTLTDTLRGTASNRADKVVHFSLYDFMRGHLLNGDQQATDYLNARGGTAFTRPGGGGPVDFTATGTNEYASDLLDPLHIEDQVGATTNDRNRAGEYFAAQLISFMQDAVSTSTPFSTGTNRKIGIRHGILLAQRGF